MLRHTQTKRYPEEFELESPAVITASNGVEMRLYACGQRVGDTLVSLGAFRVELYDEERSADVWLDEGRLRDSADLQRAGGIPRASRRTA